MNIEDRVQALENEVFGGEYGNCSECGGTLDENGYCSYPCPNCD